MDEIEPFTTLMELVESHLSKTSLQSSTSDPNDKFKLPNLNDIRKGTSSDTRFTSPGQRFASPVLNSDSKGSSITDVLARQLENTFKAKELRHQQEKDEKETKEKAIEEAVKKKRENKCMIDLTDSIIYKTNEESTPKEEEDIQEIVVQPAMESKIPLLLCNPDLSYILKLELPNRNKCSSFGRVVCARYKKVNVPI